MIAIAGGLLAALGILAGALLGASALGLTAAGLSLWILLALLAAVCLVGGGAGLLAIQGTAGTLALCYVLVVGGVLGATGTAAYGRKAAPPQTF